ncbi:MAG: hypothetical protein IJU02_07180 [Lachnospiraceae bacterium]|nr:hypothetical protein [Lachnospiraceae bacterium]
MIEGYEVLITGCIGLLTTIVSGWVSWFFARKKYNSEVDNQVIANMKESLDFYKNLSDDNRERLTQVLEQNREILEKNSQLMMQNAKLESEIRVLQAEVKALNARFAVIKKTKKNEIEG